MKNYIINLSISAFTTIIIIFIYHTVYVSNNNEWIKPEKDLSETRLIQGGIIDADTNWINQNSSSVIEYTEYPDDYNDDLIRIEDIKN